MKYHRGNENIILSMDKTSNISICQGRDERCFFPGFSQNFAHKTQMGFTNFLMQQTSTKAMVAHCYHSKKIKRKQNELQ